jgi:5-methyltetrahydrofolate--homocysteine methyltransferase
MTAQLREALKNRVLVLDGAMGTSIHSCELDLAHDFLHHENCMEIVSETRPDVIQGIHESFLAVGCDAVETNTFGCTPLTLAEFGIAARAFVLNVRAAQIARRACAGFATADKPRFVFGSIGPGTKLATLGHASYDVLKASYLEQARGLAEGGVDAFAIETCQDPLQVKAALAAVFQARREA